MAVCVKCGLGGWRRVLPFWRGDVCPACSGDWLIELDGRGQCARAIRRLEDGSVEVRYPSTEPEAAHYMGWPGGKKWHIFSAGAKGSLCGRARSKDCVQFDDVSFEDDSDCKLCWRKHQK